MEQYNKPGTAANSKDPKREAEGAGFPQLPLFRERARKIYRSRGKENCFAEEHVCMYGEDQSAPRKEEAYKPEDLVFSVASKSSANERNGDTVS